MRSRSRSEPWVNRSSTDRWQPTRSQSSIRRKDDRDADYDRLLWLGKITEGLGVLCTPRLRLLAAILDEVIELEEAGESDERPHTAH
jgi:hypothetical protein